MMLTGGQLVIKTLEQFGVEHVFGMCGHTVIGMLDALRDSKSIQFISVRHEQVAAHAADAYYKVSHKPAVVMTHIAPGLMNAVTGVAQAASDCTPLIVIAGDAPSTHFGQEAFQEMVMHADASQHEVYRPFVKRAWRVSSLALFPQVLARAFNIAYSGKPGPVLVSVPMDFMSASADLAVPEVARRRPTSYRIPGDPVEIRKAINLLVRAERPAIYVGAGVQQSEACRELLTLAEYLGLPVATTSMGKGGFPEDHDLSLGLSGVMGVPVANDVMRTADVLLGIGTRFPEQEASSWDPRYTFAVPPTKLIQVDIDPHEIGKVFPVEVGIVGDARTVLAQMIEAAEGATKKVAWQGSERVREIQAKKKAWAEQVAPGLDSNAVPIHPARILKELRSVLPRDGVVITDVGWCKNGVGQQFPVYEPQTHIGAGGLATMGWGVPAALGAKLALPDRPVVGILGDGGFSSVIQTIITAVEYRIPAKWLVMNNYAFGAIEGMQYAYYQQRTIGTQFRMAGTGEPYNPDFAAMARTMGAEGQRVDRPEQLREAIQVALASDKPYVLDVIMDPKPGVPRTGFWDISDMFA